MRTPDGSIVRSDGTLVFMSFERFRRDVCEGDCCFLCGTSQSMAAFNNEHVIPDWLLRTFKLHQRTITLPNRTTFRYGRYTVPCCMDCNSWLGKNIEEPVKELLLGSYDDAIASVSNGGAYPLLVTWLYLVFLKTHLKDTKLRLHRDLRKSREPMSSLLDLSSLHHVHCVSRALFVGTEVHQSAFPTFVMLPARTGFGEDFDYCDLSHHMAMLLQVRDKCLLLALDDSGMAGHASAPFLNIVEGPVTVFQQRELLARIAFANLWMKERPTFRTEFDNATEQSRILADVPDTFEVERHRPEDFGELLSFLVDEHLKQMVNPDLETIRAEVRSGRRTFLTDENGKFLVRSLERT